MRYNQITITYPRDSADLRSDLFALKHRYGLNVSHFCRMCIAKGIAEYKSIALESVSP